MADRRKKQLERRYNSFKRYTATEDVNYASHSSRSAYRSESVTSRTSARGRSSSTEVSTGSETRSLPVYIAIQDYNPETTDLEAVPLEQGQIVEVLDNKNAASWLVRTKARPPRTGWVPGSYFETPTEFYKQRRRTRELASGNLQMTDEQEAIMKREQVYHDLLKTEEDFVSDLSSVLENYIRLLNDPIAPPTIQQNKDELAMNFKELYNFHANVLLKGLQYYSDDPGKVGHTFIRLERDFDHHVQFYRQAPKILKLIGENQEICDYFQNLSDKFEAGARGYSDYIRETVDRCKKYADYFKEIIKYSARAGTSTKSMQKALELIQGIPKRADECVFIDNIQNYPGDKNRLSRIYRHDLFQVWEGDESPQDRYIFLFKNKMMITDKDFKPNPPIYNHYATIRLDKYTVRVHTGDEDTIVFRPNEQGLPMFKIKAKDFQFAEVVRKAWLKDINEMQEEYCPEETASRRKIKSPPGISPTGSSTSLYSGGSSIDWTTTGTTLEMQGTRVTRTQYGFRTLQESAAKMCLKVTGYPLPEITWYKDDELLKEDERRTFYADEDGFFAMTIDPVHVTDTGRYTCVATNEYGQASTSAFFRVLKVEKEAAPPAFVCNLKDQDVKEGEIVSFECEVEGWPEPELTWMVDDQPLRPSHDFRLQYDGQKAKLEIRDAQPEDTGSYAVKITNEFGSLESAAKLVVQPDPDKNHVSPEFQAVIEDVECNEGDTVRFKAVLTGDPDPEVTWIINGIPLTESEKIKFINEDGICIVTIKDVSRHFDGTVTCQGKNRLGTTTCDARLKINVPPAAPSFNKHLEDRVITEKSAVMFECIVDGFPDPKVEFFLAGRQLIHGQDGVEILQRDNNYRLTINNTSIDKHDGILIAKATNEHGIAESRAKLSVEPEEEESRSAPTFIKDIDDKTVKFGEIAKFVTTVRGNPNPTVSWFINGQKLEGSTPGITIEANGADHSLTIDSSKHAGTILCRAENSIGRFETKARLIVLPIEKIKKSPEFVEKLQDKTEIEGSTVIFEVRIDAEPRAQFKWILNGEELKENNRIHVREFDGSIKLEISDIKSNETGTIKCVATNSEGEAITEAKFTVNKKPFKPTFEQKPKNVSVERGQEAVFTCKVNAEPNPEIIWSVGGRKVKHASNFAKVEILPDGTSKLIVDTDKIVENATVSVTAENTQGIDETGALLNIEEPKPMIVTRDLKDQTVEKGALAHFEAVILNAKSVQWTINSQNLISGQEGVKISQDDQGEYRLTLDTNKFKGPISIKASNNAETIEKKALLIVTEKPREEDAPKFTDQLKDINAELGKPLTVDVIALNEPNFKWTLNGQLLEDGKNGVHILKDGNKSTLKIDEIKPEHAGLLNVVAENEAGRKETSGTITVGPAKSPAKIVEGPKSVFVAEKESVEFTTVVSGIPEPQVKWSINEIVVESSKENIEISKSGNQHFLRINEIKTSQSGKINVEVSNSEGKDSASAEIQVKPSEIKPKFSAKLFDAKVAAGEPMVFNVTLENSSPNTKVNWYLNDKKLESNEQFKIIDSKDGNYKLEILSATSDMNGTLKVRAENSKGSDESKSRIEVTTGERKPEFSKTPQDHDIEEETSVKFSAIITGIPEPEIIWYLNDQPITSNDEIRVKREVETGKTSIKIFKPRQDQTGKVKVKATNKLGTIESTAELKVNQKKEIPHFLTELSDKQVNEGSDVKFQAKIAGFPEPEVVWTLNGNPITADNVKMTQTGDLYTVEFNKVKIDQTGELAVEAKNSIGTKKENCTLAVKETGIAPNFTMNLTDRLVEERQTVVMEAQLNKEVKPKPTISWFKDGKPLSGQRYKTSYDESNGILKLTIAQAEPEDKSRITIKVENKWGSSETSASIGVTKRKPMAKPQFLSELAPIQVAEGDSLNAKVIITGDPKPIAKWYINNQLVAQTEDTELKEENGVYSMTIHGCSIDMTGKIKVVAVNRMGEISTEGKLTVIQPVPVEFETCLCDATCREGDTLKLKAVLLGEPKPDVTWFINDKKLEESQNIKIHADKGTYTVTIKDITTDYSGKVVCEAVNEFGKASSEATLLVLPRGEPPDFIEWLSNIRARQGSSVTHKVVFTGDPKPTLTWYINNKEVKDGLEGITIKTDAKTSILTIKNFNPEKHVGEIICKAENDAGEVSCTANMVAYTSDMFSESESEAMAEDVGITDDLTEIGSDAESVKEEITRTPTPIMAPKFITKIKDTRASKGHQAIFECVVPDTKGVVCKWLKDGKEIELIARIRVQTRTIEGHITNELVIDDVQPEDAGKYTVVVENSAGTERCEASLTVLESLEKPPSKAPEFTVNLKDKQAKIQDRITFECKVVGEPQPQVKWFKDNQQIFEESKKIVIETNEGIQRLVIEKAQTKDTGIYQCVAENSAGQTKTEAKLEVHDISAEAPEFTRCLTDKIVKIGEQISLECSVRGIPQPVVDFYRVKDSGEKIKLITGERISIQHDSSNTHWRIVISKTEKEDLGNYKAEAKNDVGTAISGAVVREPEILKEEIESVPVEVIPEQKKPREKREDESTPGEKSRKLKEGDTTEMNVEVTGNKPPEGEKPEEAPKPAEEEPKIPEREIRELSKTPAPENLEGPDAPAKIIEGLTNLSVKEGENVELVIHVTGKPYPQVTWLKNDEPVAMDGEHLLIKRLEDGIFKLILNKLRMDDEAVYTAKAQNKLGKDETKGKLTVLEEIISPAIVEKLKDVEIKETETIEFSTRVTGKPIPTVEWFRNGNKIQIDGSRILTRIEGNHHILIIKNAKVDETGQYIVKAVNKGGKDESAAFVKVHEDVEPPKFTDKLSSKEIKEGQFSELSVSVSGKPKPEIKWFKDGKELIPDGIHIILKSNPDYGYHSITIKNAVVDDSGIYSAKAVNKVGEDETSAKFKVLEDLERPTIISGMISKKIKEGQTTEMKVTVTGKPKPEVKWFKDGQEIFADGTRLSTRVDDDGIFNLIIKDAKLSDGGNYTAKISNKAGSTESKAELEVVEDLEAPEFIQKLKPLELTEGQIAELIIVVTGKPEPNIEWFKNGQLIQIDGNRILEKIETNGKRILILNDTKMDDSGNFLAKATNKAGTTETKAKIYVGEYIEAPRFTEKLKNLTINESETAIFECTVVGKPKPEVSWFKDGRPVFIDNKRIFEIVEDSGKRILKIEKTTKDDVGTYSCQAVNKIGASSTKCDLKLIGIVPKIEPPKIPTFISQLQPQTVKSGESAVFECRVDETTKPEISWFKNGQPVKESDQIMIQHLPDGTVKLVIKNAKPEDVGTYTVEAFNPAGKVKSEAPLNFAKEEPIEEVKTEPSEPMPRFEVPLQPQTIKLGQTATFEAKVAVYSQPEVQWFKDDKPIKPSTNLLMEQRPDGTLKLIIQNAKAEDIGKYRVIVTTKAGIAQSEAPLKFAEEKPVEDIVDENEQIKPLFIHPLKIQAVKEGENVTFECKINEGSHPQIQWYRDNVPIDAKPNLLIEHHPDGTLRLTIKKVKNEDIGNYRCEAVNKAGKAETEAPLKYAQLIDLKIPGEEKLEVFDEEIVEEPEKVKVIQDKSTAAVETIAHTRAEYVVIQDEVEAIDKQGVGAPEFVQLLRSALTSTGGEAILRCKVKGEPRPTIKWTQQGKEVEMSSRIISEYLEDGSISLILKNAQESDVGEYRCEATNDYGSAWTEAPIILAAAGTLPKDGEAPDFLEPVRPVTVKQGTTAILQGKICGTPQPSIKWYKAGKEILKSDTRYEIESTEDGLQKLILKDAKFEDIGEYRCEITNRWGDAFSDATLTVHAAGTLEEGQTQVVPSFSRKLQQTTVKEHEHTEFECEVGGTPQPEIKWLKDGKPIPISDKHFKQTVDSDGKAKLIIEKAELADVGKYTCEATNEAGKDSTSADLNIIKAEKAPEFVQKLQPIKAREGERIVFNCKVEAEPAPMVKWYKNGDEIKPGKGTKIESKNDGTQQLVVEEVHMVDQAEYKVEAINKVGKAISEAPLKVEPLPKLKLKKGLEDQQVEEGSRVNLRVEVEGKAKTVKWFKGNKELKEFKQSHVEKLTEEEYKLTIEKAELKDTGNYRVVLASDNDSIESSCQITVILKAVKDEGKPSFKKGLSDQKVKKGSPLKLEIEIDGKPKEIKWYKNGNELKPDGKKIKAEDLGNGKYALVIPSTDDDDFGNYSVVISNDNGSAESKAKVSQEGDEKPEILSGLKPVSVKPDERAVFEIETKGPIKEVKWYKNGEELKDAQTENFNGKKFRLVIPSAKKEDVGDYKVVVINDGGQADSSAPLSVGGATPIKFVKPLNDLTAKKGETVPLEIELDKKPKEVKWYKNGQEIKPGNKEEPKKISDTKYQLVVPDVDADGQFKVVVISDDDVPTDSSCKLTVKLPAKPGLKFVKPLEDLTVNKGETVPLEVELDGKPKDVKWEKDGKEIKPGDKEQPKKVSDTKYQLVIPDVDADGKFKVVVTNDDDMPTDSGCKLTVKLPAEPKLTFLKPLKDTEVVEGKSAEFEVETNAEPKTVKWYKNGQEIKPSDAHFEIKKVGDTKFKLIIPKADKNDAGTFKIVLENASGAVDSSANLTVKTGTKNPPKIVKSLEDTAVAKGDALIFEIKVDGDVDTIRWLKDGQPVEKANALAKIEKLDGNTYRLTIPKTDVKDAGQYTVEVSNDGGKATSSAKGEIDEKPEIVKGLVPSKIDEDDDQVFKVEVSAPVREVKWYKNGQEIKPNAHFSPKQIGPKKFEMVINKAQLDDGATYKVVLSNKAGSCESSADLEVAKPNVLKLIKGLTDIDVDEDQPLTLSCKIEGTPKSVKWLKNGKEITADERVKLSSNPETGEYSLTVDSAIPGDGAAYRVVFVNEKGELQSGAVAHVKAGKKKEAAASPATFITPLANVDIEEGDALTLKCKVGGQPQPEVKWYRNGEELKPSDRVTIRLALDGTATLRILDSKKSDAGQYKVVASNPSGTVESACKVGVLSSDEMPSAPKFIIPLKSTDAPLGAKVEFNIKVRGVPKPTLRFQIDGRTLPIDGNRIVLDDMHDGNWCLTIKDLKEEDFGTIRCVAQNEHGKDECECIFEQTGGRKLKIRDEEGYPPKFNVPLWDRRIPEGQLMFIECHVDAKPLAEITWTFNGDELKPGQGIQVENTPEGACRVKISEFRQQHIGTYKCFAKNEYGTADTIATLNVEVPKEEQIEEKIEFAPKFHPGLEDKSLNENAELFLSCKVDAKPTAYIQWYKDGLPIKASDRLKWTYNPNTGECTLRIASVKEGDEGAYRCVASNHLGSTNTACMVAIKTKKLEIKKQGEEPFFTKSLSDKYVDRGETIELHCAVTGDPMPEIKWYRNGVLLRSSGRVTIENTPDGNCKLTVKEVTMSDEGIYRCEAENPLGKAKTQCTAHVQMSIKREKTPIVEGEMPKFVIPLEDSSVRPGDLIELECKVTGVPMPSLKWSKDGQPLIEDNRFEWETQPDKGIYKLRIKNAILYDEGTYRAVATNESGSANSKAMIRIDDGLFKGKAEPSTAPRITVRLADVRVTEGQPLRLNCKIEGTPTPEVVWYKDGERVNPSDRIQIETSPDGSSKLIIPKATMDDDGIYRVIATNPAGSAVDKCTATVRRSPKGMEDGGYRASPSRTTPSFDSSKAPRCVVPLDNVRIPETQPFKLRCKFAGEPKPAIKWFKDGERIYAYEHVKLVEHPDGTCELIVDSASKSDAGMYRCIAENEFGSARTTCEVIVQLKDRTKRNLDDQLREGNAPGFSIPLTMKRARPGESVVFECLPYGKPFPTIKWLKDGIELVPNNGIKIESLNDETQRLIVDNVDFLSEGFYRCVATNEYGTASTKAELALIGERRPVNGIEKTNGGPPEESKPRIRRGLYPMSIHQGNPVEMQVVATGWPTPTIKWFKNGEEIRSEIGEDARRTIWIDDRNVHHCVIINCKPEDEGDYMVIATNPLGEAKTEGPLAVIRPRYALDEDEDHGMPFPPGFIRQLKNKHVFTHMPTIFDCLVVGHPPPTVDWYHNGKKIIPDGRTKIQVAGGGSHALLIMDTNLEDAGEYVAIAKNSHGTATSSAILDVTVPHLDDIKFDGSFDITPYLTEEYGFKTINYKCLPTPPDRGPFIKEVTGHYLTLSWIPTKRSPPRYPQVTYVIEIRELPDRDWQLLDYNIPEPVCKVRNLELGKSYQFRVRAENIYGISDPSPASPPSRLMAPPPPVLDKNKRIIPLMDPYCYTEKYLDQAYAEQYACAPWFTPGVIDKRYCAEKDTITISLTYSGYPDPKIQWKFRGWDVDTTTPTTNIKVHSYGGAETILTISGFKKENVGQYQCFATNQYGEAQQNIMIEIAERPKFIQPLLDRIFSDGKPMKLDVRVEGSPFPELKWMKDWKPIVESHRIKFVQEGPYLCSMIISNPIWRDSGIYSVIAINDAGQSTTSCTVTVEADGEYNDVQLPRKRVTIESKKIHEIYEIDETEEKKSSTGAPFLVKDKKTEEIFIGQLKPFDDSLKRGVRIHNILDHPSFVQFRQIIAENGQALIVFENADSSLLENLLPLPKKNDKKFQKNREEEVRIFVKQLLTALQYMHHRNIVHLDLRPEVILLQDNHLKLADFGQSRHLLAGKAYGEIQSTPEFVAPEIALGEMVTLASDMWSVGVLTYVLLTGLSPFLGDNDNETLSNVVRGDANFNVPELNQVSPEAKSFLTNLLQVPQIKRMSVDQALMHDWMNDPNLENAKLSTDCLREFKYQHKWLERRVFVQQTPSEQFTQLIQAPESNLAKSQSETIIPDPLKAEPFAIYDYLRIKDTKQQPEIPDYDRRGRPQRPISKSPQPFDQFGSFPPPPEYFDPKKIPEFDPRDPKNASFDPRNPSPGFDPRSQSPQDPRNRQLQQGSDLRDPFTGRIPTPEELRQLIEQHLPPGVKYPPGIKPEDLLFVLPPNYRQGQPLSIPPPGPGGMPQGRASSSSPQIERRRLQPQEKGETPSQNTIKSKKPIEEDEELDIQPPIRLVRGEKRDIEEEIANRILSDISEENSIAGSLASMEDFEPYTKMANNRKSKSTRRSRSRSSTPLAEGSEGSITPTGSPGPNNDIDDPLKKFFGDKIPDVPEFNDPKVPVGAPVFIDGLGKAVVTMEQNGPKTRSSLSPCPKSGTPGTKSPITISPGREHQMEVVIATKRGKQCRTSPMKDSVEPLKKKSGFEDDEDDLPKSAKNVIHYDPDFDDLMTEVDRLKNKYKTIDDDLDKYRPKNFYKEDIDLHRPETDIDDYPWESNYQIGPDTLLLASKGPDFNARVRDYRRELWGDGAPLVRQGFLGYRNQDITVRERRRFTDLIREDPEIAKTVGQTVKNSEVIQNGAVRKITTTNVTSVPFAVKKNSDGTFGAIFRSRLKDVCFNQNAGQLSFTCYVIGNPAPEITWYHHENLLVEDGRHRIFREGEKCTLNILKPTLADIGEYSCQAVNDHGKDRCSGRMVTGEVPGRPGRPEIELSSDTEVLVTWEPPESNTFLEGITYKVEARPAGENDYFTKWTTISDNVDDEAVLVKHLLPQGIYQFRVTAKNGFGWGVPSLTSRIIRTHPKGAPKLQQDFLRDQLKFSVVTMPVRKHKTDPGLTEISEEAEEEASEEELSVDDSIMSNSKESKPLTLNKSEDPLSRFQLENDVFAGRYSLIKNAVDTKSMVTKHVVAKIRIQNKEFPANLSEEFETLKSAQHENVVTLFAAYETNNTLLLFTERLYEGIFDRFCYPDYYNEEQIALTIRQLTSALHWIHFKGVIHLDVQPDNVMFANKRSWIVKLIDFEESQFVDTPNIKKRKSANPEWAAPELLQSNGVPTVQTDVWGMGVICFTLLAGFHPFSDEEENEEEIKEAVCKQKCDPNLIPVQATQEALRFATWAIKKNPARRIRTDEALSHRWLSNDKQISRRREGIKYPSNRLRRTTLRTLKRQLTQPDDFLINNYGKTR